MIKLIQLFGMLFLLSSTVVAGTVVEIQKNNEITTAITDGQRVRMDKSASEYVILDSSDHSIKIVNTNKQLVTLVNAGDATADSNTAAVHASISLQGHGQTVAGYRTQKFSYAANGKYCGVIYGSINAYETEGVRELLAAMKIMMEKQRAALGGFASLVDACTLADMQLVDFVDSVGLPMRTEKNGSIELEVKSINTDVVLAADTFAIPAAYKTVDMSGRVIAGSQNIAVPEQAISITGRAINARQPQGYHTQQPRMPPQTQSGYMPRQVRQPRPMYPPTGYQAGGLPQFARPY